MSIICDYPGCGARTHQPLPSGWTAVYGPQGWTHLCPTHAGAAGLSEAQAGTARARKRGRR